MSFQSTLNSSLVPDLALPNGLQYIVDNDRSDGLAGQILSSNNGGGLLWINGGGSGGGNVSTNTNNDFTANNTFSDNGATQAEFIVSTGKTIFTTQPLFEAGLNVLDGIVTFQTQVSFDDIILDNGGSSGLSGQVLTAGTGGQVIWGAGGSGGGDVYLAGDNVYTGTNQFTTKGIICNSINSTTNTGALQVIGSALGVSNGGLTSAILVGAANTNIFTSSTTPLMNGTSCNISVQDDTGATVECFDFNAITNQSTIPFLFNSSIYDNNGDTGIAGQVLTAGTGSQVVWGAGGGGGGGDVYLAGGVSAAAPQTFTGYNKFNNALSVNSITPSTGQLNFTCGAIEMINAPTQLSLTINQETLEFQVSNSVGDPTSVIIEVLNDIGLGVQAMNISSIGINLGVPLTTSYIYEDYIGSNYIGFSAVLNPAPINYTAGVNYNIVNMLIPASGIWTFNANVSGCTPSGILSITSNNTGFNNACIVSTLQIASLSYTTYIASGSYIQVLYENPDTSSTLTDIYLTSTRIA